jgi:hypothetical protein
MPGVVSLPHGWGHDQPGAELRVARAHAGVNSNLLADETAFDPLSGNAVLNGIPVTVTRASVAAERERRGPLYLQPSFWSALGPPLKTHAGVAGGVPKITSPH